MKLVAKANKALQDEQVEQRKLEKQYKYIDGYVKQSEKAAKEEEEKVRLRHQEEMAEKARQEKEGVVSKPANIGRFKYSMRKTDFQLEDELAGSMRQVRAQGQADLLRDRFDSVFRRNMVECDAPSKNEKKRFKKKEFKWKER